MAKGGGGDQRSESTSEYRIPDWYRPHVQGLFGSAQTALNQTDKTPYTGEMFARMGQGQRDAMGLGMGAAQGMQDWWQPTHQLAQDTLQGRYLDLNQNPVFNQYADAATRPVYDQLLDQGGTLDQQLSQSLDQGAYGGAASEIARGMAMTRAARDAADIRAQLGGQVYGMERGYQQQAPEMMAMAGAQRMAPIETMLGYGGMEQGERQAINDEALQRYQMNLMAPWRGLSEYASILGSVPVGGTQYGTSTQHAPGGSPLLGGLQGGLGGAATGAQMGAPFGPWGALIGGGVGLLGGGYMGAMG